MKAAEQRPRASRIARGDRAPSSRARGQSPSRDALASAAGMNIRHASASSPRNRPTIASGPTRPRPVSRQLGRRNRDPSAPHRVSKLVQRFKLRRGAAALEMVLYVVAQHCIHDPSPLDATPRSDKCHAHAGTLTAPPRAAQRLTAWLWVSRTEGVAAATFRNTSRFSLAAAIVGVNTPRQRRASTRQPRARHSMMRRTPPRSAAGARLPAPRRSSTQRGVHATAAT